MNVHDHLSNLLNMALFLISKGNYFSNAYAYAYKKNVIINSFNRKIDVILF